MHRTQAQKNFAGNLLWLASLAACLAGAVYVFWSIATYEFPVADGVEVVDYE
jgi:hypothetical protein